MTLFDNSLEFNRTYFCLTTAEIRNCLWQPHLSVSPKLAQFSPLLAQATNLFFYLKILAPQLHIWVTEMITVD